jgi:hypothetical protein
MPSPHPGGAVLYVDFSWRLIRAGVRASCFWIERPKGNGSDNNLLQKIRNQVKHALEQSGPSACQNASSRSGGFERKGKSARKNFPRFKPHNPLKSLDSDERIQGNPRQFNPHERWPSERNSHEPRKPKRSTGPRSRLVAGTEPNRIHPNAKRAKPRKSACEMRVAKGAAFLAACPRLPTRASRFQARPRPRAAE